MRRFLGSALAVLVAAIAAAPAAASPVKCADGDSTPDGRVFPEADVSTNFLRFDEFECGTALLEQTLPAPHRSGRLIGESKGGRPLYDIVLTDERVKRAKQKLLVVSSIHGDEVGGREGGVRVLEDMVDPRLLNNAANPWVARVMKRYEIHFLFPNPDGWAKGDVIGSYRPGVLATRGNDSGRDLNRQFPVKGWIDFDNAPLAEPEGNAVMEKLFSQDDWYLGTDNHGQGPDTYGAAGLQIVGQFDFQKSETLARFADGITESMKDYNVLSDLEELRAEHRPGHGRLPLGHALRHARLLGVGLDDRLLQHGQRRERHRLRDRADRGPRGQLARLPGSAEPGLGRLDPRDQLHDVQARGRPQGLHLPGRLEGGVRLRPEGHHRRRRERRGSAGCRRDTQRPYRVSRMKFFKDLNKYADRPLKRIRVKRVLRGKVKLSTVHSSIVLANDAMPEGRNAGAWFAQAEALGAKAAAT